MSKIQIICTQPGIRRNGVQHPASAIYDEDHWTVDQIKAFKADPAFIVQAASANGVEFSDAEIEAEVERRLTLKRDELQASFNSAVATAVAEKLASTTAATDNTIDDLGKKLSAANDTIADLRAKLETTAATAAQGVEKATAKK